MAAPAPEGFVVKPVRNRTTGGLRGSDTIGLVLHVQAGNGELSGWFNNPAAKASSTWWAGKGGGRRQYGNPDTDKFWAQAAGNPLYHSIETEGQPSEPLTPEQIETCAVAYAFGHVRYGWPFRLAEKPGQPGLGWHGMGGAAWGGHTGCPGDKRKAQRTQILARAKQIVGGQPNEEDDMPSADEVADAVVRKLINYPGPDAVNGKPRTLWRTIADAATNTDQLDYRVWAYPSDEAGRTMWNRLTGAAAQQPQVTAEQVAAAIPDTIAQQVVDALAARLNAPKEK